MVFRSAGWRNRMLGIRVLPPRNSQGNPHQEIRKVVRHASCCATLTSLKSISYENVVAFRAVIGSDGMTADWYHSVMMCSDVFPVILSTRFAASIASSTT